MDKIVNLNRARKAQVKAQAAETAAANRIKFGRTRAQKEAASLEQARAARALDRTRREEP
jgi:hypothetical protein